MLLVRILALVGIAVLDIMAFRCNGEEGLQLCGSYCCNFAASRRSRSFVSLAKRLAGSHVLCFNF